MKSKLTFWGGVGTVTGANFLFEPEGDSPLKIMVDCGFFQGEKFATDANAETFPYEPSSVDFLFVTHAHADHIGRIPKLVREGFHGKIYSTPATRLIAEIMFDDAMKIMARERQAEGKPPLYEKEDISKALSLWNDLPYHATLDLPDGFSVKVLDAGHILGSAMYEFSRSGKKILFTGDLGNTPSPLVPDTESPKGANYIVMESVYGDKNHEDPESRVSLLRDAVQSVIDKKGVLIIPAFSLERTQVILYELNKLVEGGQLEAIPVFLDSPLAIKVTEVYRKEKDLFKETVRDEIAAGDNIFKFPKLKFTPSVIESHKIDLVPNPKIIIAGGGMSEGGRVMGHEKNYLPDEMCTVLLVGFQAAGTLGRALAEGAKSVKINGEEVAVRSEIRMINGFSSHKDSDHLLEFAAEAAETLERVFVVMGEPKASMYLAQRINNETGVKALLPERGESYSLEI